MVGWNPAANAVFLDARDQPPGPARDAFVKQACQGDEQLEARVAALLDAERRAGAFLSSPAERMEPSALAIHGSEKPGSMIGPYKLLQEIGEGGMGVVFMAEQCEPVRRTVAFKIIKAGMDTRQVVARFEAERQALALMDHPNIAKVLDAGATEAGRPFFVMELVKGQPITQYCDEQRLTLRERMELFIPVCQAVQHAHQKGIIHRDLKPSNVMIALYDGRPVPKVIDFGVAKATGPKLTELTMFTEFGTVVGTLEYMSPEQAELNQLDVDTRSDVYSLGVLLYELVTGSTPLDAQRLRSATFDEMRRIIREEEPARPSTRLSSSAKLPALAAQRRQDPSRLAEHVRGDMDWIIMKALEKDRTRRYETANALARDLERFLANEPVEARPPTAAYRFRKFSRRHRGTVAAAALLTAVLLAGVGVSAWQAIRATRAERAALASAALAKQAEEAERRAKHDEATQRKKAEDLVKFLAVALGVATPDLRQAEIKRLIERGAQSYLQSEPGAPAAKAALLLSLGRSYASRRIFDAAERELRMCLAIADDPAVVHEARYELATTLLWRGQFEEGTAYLRDLFLEKLRRISSPEAEELRAAWPGLSHAAAKRDDRPGYEGLELDGQNDYVVLPSLQFDGRPPWTLEAIVKPAAIDQFAVHASSRWTSLVSTTDGGGVGLESNVGVWSIGLYTADVHDDTWENNYATAFARNKPALNQWQHVAGVWDGKELRIYVNGRLEGTQAGVDECSSLSEGPFLLGADPSDLDANDIAEGLFQGVIQAARISRGVEYRVSFPQPRRLDATPETIGLYDFTIATGRYAIDRSGHGHHGIIVGAKFVKDAN